MNSNDDINERYNAPNGFRTKTPQVTFVPIIRRNAGSSMQKGGRKNPSYRVVSSSGEYERNGNMRKRSRSPSGSPNRHSRRRSPSADRRLIGGTVEAVNRNTPGSKAKHRRLVKSPQRRRNSRGRSSSRSRSPSPSKSGRRGRYIKGNKSLRAKSPSRNRQRNR